MRKVYSTKKSRLHIVGWSAWDMKITIYSNMAQNWNLSIKTWQNWIFLSTLPAKLRWFAKIHLKSQVRLRCKLRIYRFVEKQRDKVLVLLWRLMPNSFVIQKQMLISLLLEDIVDWVLFTLSTTCFIKAKLDETLSCGKRILFSYCLPVMWFQLVRLVHNWYSD